MRRTLLLALLTLLCVAVLAWFGLPYLQQQPAVSAAQASLPTGDAARVTPSLYPADTLTASPLPSATATPAAPITLADPIDLEANLNREGLLVLAMRDGLYSHLFAYHPLYLPLTHITDTPWDDITPAISPDGTRLAFSSRANGYWDLYIINLVTGERTRLTDTPDYEASPSWSPDSQWLVYERFNGVNSDIYLLQLDGAQEPIQLTTDPAMDHSPAWAQQGRQIAFTSTRSGDEDIWLADLDNVDDRFVNLSANARARDRSPVWSRDGSRLAWTAESDGNRQLMVWSAAAPGQPAYPAGEGDVPLWSPDNSLLFSEVRLANESGLAAYQAADGHPALRYTRLPGALYGMTWVTGPLPAWLAGFSRQGNQSPPPLLANPVLSNFPIAPTGRMSVIDLPDVSAPQPKLHDAVDEVFNDLRRQVGLETGWDALSSLENAFTALTTPPTPSMENDWLYTGRAFTLNPLLLSAGWMTIAHENFGGQTYWRIYLKARFQDGSMGKPLHETVWDLNARYAGDPRAYETGGRLAQPPPGYWIDLTELAARYSWGRTPSLTNWRTFYPAIRYNMFVISGGLDWNAAMAQIYPSEALATTTPMPTYTLIPRDMPEGTFTPTLPTRTPTITQVPTRRPTWTPLP